MNRSSLPRREEGEPKLAELTDPYLCSESSDRPRPRQAFTVPSNVVLAGSTSSRHLNHRVKSLSLTVRTILLSLVISSVCHAQELGPGANLIKANLVNRTLVDLDLTGANLSGANLSGAKLSGVDLTGADLTGANLAYADLNSADLFNANLTGADLTGANWNFVNLTDANLTGANLTLANLFRANNFNSLLNSPGVIFQGTIMPIGPTRTDPMGPYGNVDGPWPIPGRIEAENYDSGGQGQAYHDVDSANHGFNANSANYWRALEGVDIEKVSNHEDGGFTIGWTAAGEWTAYTVEVSEAGQYVMNARMASGANGGSFTISFDGGNPVATVSVPGTGGWQSWVTQTSTPFQLNAGVQVMRITWLTDGANLNYVVFRKADASAPNDHLLRPGDPIIAINQIGDSGSPDGEDVSRAIDGSHLTKYLNARPRHSGFIVTPSVGTTVVNGFTLTTANDLPARDPAEWVLFGTLSDTITTPDHGIGYEQSWTPIASGVLNLPFSRRTAGLRVTFDNQQAYKSYRFLVPQVRDIAGGGVMQFAEIQFHGTVGEVGKQTPAITWNPPAVIESGTPLGPQQLNATATISGATVPGTFQYSPASGAILAVGSHPLEVVFTPDDTSVYNVATGTAFLIVPSPGPLRQPYGNNGQPWPVPGRIEAEHFDEGGQGVAYHDKDPWNEGAFQYGYENSSRTHDGVDIERVADGEGGMFNVGWTETGEWTAYTVHVAETGQYVLDARMASGSSGGTFAVIFGNGPIATIVSVPGTGGWQSWITETSAPFELNAGTQVMWIAWKSGGANLNHVVLRPADLSAPDEDLLRPGDAIVAINLDGISGSPEGEEVFRAIDGYVYTKYQNVQPNNSGFIVTPSVGATVLKGFTMTTANDLPQRDPARWALFGTDEDITTPNHGLGTEQNWTPIASGLLILPEERLTQAHRVIVPNQQAYRSYRFVVPRVRDLDEGFVMQFSEIQFHGTIVDTEKQTPILTWNTPGPIPYGTALGAAQLNSIANVPGSFLYNPQSGTRLNAGAHTLQVDFTPEDPDAYHPATATVSLTVNQVPLTVTADNQTRQVGEVNPPFTASYSGFVSGEDATHLVGTLTFSTDAQAGSPAGTYSITPSGLSSANYDIQFVNGTLTVLDPIPSGQQPYGNNGQPWPVPGRIEAEHFDTGGEGIAYHDIDGSNRGFVDGGADNSIRHDEGVDIERVFNDDGEYNIGYVDVGEWTEYTVNVIEPGTYVLDARMASFSQGGTFEVSFGKNQATATVSVPGTGGWQTWVTQTSDVLLLEAGVQVMRITWLTTGANLNHVVLRKTDGVTPGEGLLRPWDTILAIDLDGNSSSPPNEVVSMAIDRNVQTKYLNFGLLNSGFIVTPGVGPTVVTGFTMTTANDLDARDPVSWELHGTLDTIVTENHGRGDRENWNLIASGTLELPAERLTPGTPVTFEHSIPYTSYRFVVRTVKGAANSTQFSEIQFHGIPFDETDPDIREKLTPSLLWNPVSPITYGTPLGSQQLNATAWISESAISGTFQYTPGQGSIPEAGELELQVLFTPENQSLFKTATASVSLTVDKALLTVTANSHTRQVGQANPAFGAVYSGFAAGEGPSNLGGTLSFATTAGTDSPAGTYSITPSGLTSGNYDIQFVPGTLTVVGVGPEVVWISEAANTVGLEYVQLLEANGYRVTRRQYAHPDASQLEELNGSALVVISRQGSAANFNHPSWDQEVRAPLLLMNAFLARHSGWGWVDGDTVVESTGEPITPQVPGHPLFQGLTSIGAALQPWHRLVDSGTSLSGNHPVAEGQVLATTPTGMVAAEWPPGTVAAGHRLLFNSGSRESTGADLLTAGKFDLTPEGERALLNAVSYLITANLPVPQPVWMAVERIDNVLWISWPGGPNDTFQMVTTTDLGAGPRVPVPTPPVFQPARGTWTVPVGSPSPHSQQFFLLAPFEAP